MEETERSLHDAIMIVRRAIKVCYVIQYLILGAIVSGFN